MADSSLPLAGKVALVTGGARNIGRQISLALAAEGADVVVNARGSAEAAAETAKMVEALGRRSFAHLCDVTDPAAVRTWSQRRSRASAGSTSW